MGSSHNTEQGFSRVVRLKHFFGRVVQPVEQASKLEMGRSHFSLLDQVLGWIVPLGQLVHVNVLNVPLLAGGGLVTLGDEELPRGGVHVQAASIATLDQPLPLHVVPEQ